MRDPYSPVKPRSGFPDEMEGGFVTCPYSQRVYCATMSIPTRPL